MKIPTLRWLPAIIAATSLTLAGCAGSGGSGEQSSSGLGDIPTDTNATVRVLMENVPDTDIVKGLVGQFNQKYPDIKVEIETMTFDQMRDRLVSSFQASQPAYDLIVVDNPWMDDFADAGLPGAAQRPHRRDPGLPARGFFDSLTAITDVEGTTYGVPFYNYALGYIYNTGDLTSPGRASPPIWTPWWPPRSGSRPPTARASRCSRSAATRSSRSGPTGCSPPAARSTVRTASPRWTPPKPRALDAYIETYKTAAPANSLSWGFDEAFRSVSSGMSASMIGYNWNLPALNDPEGASAERAGQFALAPIPGGKSALGLWSWAIPANSGAADAAWAFASWVTSPAIDAERVADGGAVIRQGSLTDPKVLADGYGADYYKTVGEILADAAPLTQGKGGEEMIQAVGTELNDAAAGNKSVADALRDAQAAAERIQQ